MIFYLTAGTTGDPREAFVRMATLHSRAGSIFFFAGERYDVATDCTLLCVCVRACVCVGKERTGEERNGTPPDERRSNNALTL